MELKQLSDIYKQKEVDGEIHEYLFKKNVVTRRYLDSARDIASIEELISKSGNPYKSRCSVTLTTGEQIIVKHTYEELKQYKQKIKITGFYGTRS